MVWVEGIAFSEESGLRFEPIKPLGPGEVGGHCPTRGMLTEPSPAAPICVAVSAPHFGGLLRQLVLQMQVSVDGYVARRSQGPSWQVWDFGREMTWDAELSATFRATVEAADCILLSRKMAEGGYIDHWTAVARELGHTSDYAFARHVTEARKVVFSRNCPAIRWPNTELATQPLAEAVIRLKMETGKNIIAFGGTGFAAALIGFKLVDELQLYVNPTAIHAGDSIFPPQASDLRFNLVGAAPYACGIVVMRYRPISACT